MHIGRNVVVRADVLRERRTSSVVTNYEAERDKTYLKYRNFKMINVNRNEDNEHAGMNVMVKWPSGLRR